MEAPGAHRHHCTKRPASRSQGAPRTVSKSRARRRAPVWNAQAPGHGGPGCLCCGCGCCGSGTGGVAGGSGWRTGARAQAAAARSRP
eukprot:248795-Alexandrium_andersonii.AAC.1